MWLNKFKSATLLIALASSKLKFNFSKKHLAIFLLWLAVFWSTWIGYNLNALVTHLESGSISSAAISANRTYPTLKFFDQLSLKSLPDLHFSVVAIESLQRFDEHRLDISKTVQQVNDPSQDFSYQPFKNLINPLADNSKILNELLPKTWIIKNHISGSKLETAHQLLSQSQQLIEFLETGERTMVIMLQNSHELRATGGFAGSFAYVRTYPNQPPTFEIQDIYVPDGQFTGFIQPPPGVDKYLSSGNGLRLPDANWYPDFPTSANQMLRFFALGDQSEVDVIATINLDLVEQILQIIGPLEVVDYDQTVTAQNLTTIARADRDDFFAGSQQKANFLNSLATQLRYELNQLSPAQLGSIAELIKNGVTHKQIQAYSIHPEIQTLFENSDLANHLYPIGDLGFYLVESNVGINKANQLVSRQVEIDVQQYRSQVTITFDNQNSSQPLPGESTRNYINYYRILTTPEVEVSAVSIDGQPAQIDHSRGFKTWAGESFLETGFLVEVPTQQEVQVSFSLAHPALPTKPRLFIYHQSGLPATPYTIYYLGETVSRLVESDVVVEF